MASYNCGNCGNPGTSAISYLFAENTKAAASSMLFIGPHNEVSNAFSSSQESGLVARWFAPPVKPELGGSHLVTIGLISVPGIIYACYNLCQSAAVAKFWLILVLSVVAGFAVAAYLEEKVKEELPVWKRRNSIYRRVVHCKRCNHVTDVLTRNNTQANRIATLYGE